MTKPLGEITATFRCTACDQPTSLSVDDDDQASCSNCGEAFGPMSEIRASVRKQSVDMARSAVRKAFQRR